MGKLHDELGREVVRMLSGAAGGRYVSVPFIFKEGSKIDRIFGSTLAILLIDHFPGDRIYIPMHPSVYQLKAGHVKTDEVLEFHNRGMTAEEVASHLKTTVRTVRIHLQKARAASLEPTENKQ